MLEQVEQSWKTFLLVTSAMTPSGATPYIENIQKWVKGTGESLDLKGNIMNWRSSNSGRYQPPDTDQTTMTNGRSIVTTAMYFCATGVDSRSRFSCFGAPLKDQPEGKKRSPGLCTPFLKTYSILTLGGKPSVVIDTLPAEHLLCFSVSTRIPLNVDIATLHRLLLFRP